ncbi:MAG TPA: tetratricopeptide repeat protein, partial [Woeseiaceae bacterium]|nr:tetratricopeptide repeat protein [Woeseiaceae bacterium]
AEEALQALGNIQHELPQPLQWERLNLRAQILIERGDYAQAIDMLSAWRGRTEWSGYARFNLGVALARSGQLELATGILDELGQQAAWNEETVALRDKTNLALGYAYLQGGQPRAAKSVLQRVRLNGPFSNKALLGIGWAEAEVENYDRALVPWVELRGRSLLDPAVQESMLAVPYAMAKLDSISQAADYYLDAIEAFYEEGNRIDRTIDALRSGALLTALLSQDTGSTTGWQWTLSDLPEGSESRYLFSLLATHEFQEALKNYRDLDYLARNLADWQDSLDVYENMLHTRTLAYRSRLPVVEQSLSRADLESMVDSKLALDTRVERIAGERDTLALASEREFELWGEIASMENRAALNADIPEAREVRQKLGLLKGVLIWRLDKQYRERLYELRRKLRDTGEALVVAQRSRRQIDQSMRDEPQTFAAFGERIDGLAPRIASLAARVDKVRIRQQQYLQDIAIGEMQARKDRLDTYTVQARFALAAIYDRSSSAGGASP